MPELTQGTWARYKSVGCTHEGATAIMKVGKAGELWAGGEAELLAAPVNWALIVSAVGYVDFLTSPIQGNDIAKLRLPLVLFQWEPPACIGIHWPDRGVPTVGPEWWAELASAIKDIDGKVGLCCLGGHGRTGTMLAILASLLGKVKKKQCPVSWVRVAYCKEAVESEAQIEYIEWITGRTVTSSPSDEYKRATSAPSAASAGGWECGQGVNPTPAGAASGKSSTATPIGSTSGDDDDDATPYTPTDQELEDALAGGEDGLTGPIEGAPGRCWAPVYDGVEIVGWYEEDSA